MPIKGREQGLCPAPASFYNLVYYMLFLGLHPQSTLRKLEDEGKLRLMRDASLSLTNPPCAAAGKIMSNGNIKENFEKALNDIFADYNEHPQLGEIKAEMLAVLEDRFKAMRKRGIIEKAAIKKVLSDLDRTVKSAELAAKGDRQKRLKHIANALGVSPLGQRMAMLRLAAIIAAGFGLLAAGAAWITGGSAAGALGALLPFAAVAAGLFIYVRRTSRAATKA